MHPVDPVWLAGRAVFALLALGGVVGMVAWRDLRSVTWPELRSPWVWFMTIVGSFFLVAESFRAAMVLPLIGDEADTFDGLSWSSLPEVVLRDEGLPGLVYTPVVGIITLVTGLGGARAVHCLLMVGFVFVVMSLCRRLEGGAVTVLAAAALLVSEDRMWIMHSLRPHALANVMLLTAMAAVSAKRVGPGERALAVLLVGIAALDNPLYMLCLPVVALAGIARGSPGLGFGHITSQEARRMAFGALHVAAVLAFGMSAVSARPPQGQWQELFRVSDLLLMSSVMAVAAWLPFRVRGKQALRLSSPLLPALVALFLGGALFAERRYMEPLAVIATLTLAANIDRMFPTYSTRSLALIYVVASVIMYEPDRRASLFDEKVIWKDNVRSVFDLLPADAASEHPVLLAPSLTLVEAAVILESDDPLDTLQPVTLPNGLEITDGRHLPAEESVPVIALGVRRPQEEQWPMPDVCEPVLEREEGWIALCPSDAVMP